MKDNLPEINVKGLKKEKKGGFLGGLRGLGSGARGGIGAAGSSSAGAAGSAGLGALLAGNLSTILAAVVVIGLVGGYVANNKAPAPVTSEAASASANGPRSEYVPAILRRQAANQGSSLAMFTEKNKGSGLSLQETAAGAKKAAENAAKDKAAASGEPAEDPSAQAGDAQDIAEGAAGGLQGGPGASSLTTSIGGGSGKFAGMVSKGGGLSTKVGMSNNVGTGFQAMPRFQERKGKLLAMKGAARPVFSKGDKGKAAKFTGSGRAWNSARFTAKTQARYGGANAELAAGAQNAAWQGETGTGGAEAEGMGEGEQIVTSPSIDNVNGKTGGGGSSGNYTPTIPKSPCPACDSLMSGDSKTYMKCVLDKCPPEDLSPWSKTASACNILILAACALALIGGALVNVKVPPWVAIVGYVICAIAIACAAVAVGLAIYLGVEYKQGWMAAIYGVGAGLAGTAAIMALTGNAGSAAAVPVSWVAMAAMLCSSIAGTLASK